MILNFSTNEETKFVSGTYNGKEFSLAPRFTSGDIVPLTEAEALAKLEWADSLPDTSNMELKMLREVRDRKLANTDWWVMPDRTATQAQLDYRQALRDITETYTSLDDVVWPNKPN